MIFIYTTLHLAVSMSVYITLDKYDSSSFIPSGMDSTPWRQDMVHVGPFDGTVESGIPSATEPLATHHSRTLRSST